MEASQLPGGEGEWSSFRVCVLSSAGNGGESASRGAKGNGGESALELGVKLLLLLSAFFFLGGGGRVSFQGGEGGMM